MQSLYLLTQLQRPARLHTRASSRIGEYAYLLKSHKLALAGNLILTSLSSPYAVVCVAFSNTHGQSCIFFCLINFSAHTNRMRNPASTRPELDYLLTNLFLSANILILIAINDYTEHVKQTVVLIDIVSCLSSIIQHRRANDRVTIINHTQTHINHC